MTDRSLPTQSDRLWQEKTFGLLLFAALCVGLYVLLGWAGI